MPFDYNDPLDMADIPTEILEAELAKRRPPKPPSSGMQVVTIWPTATPEENELMDKLKAIRESAFAEAKPYIDRLVKLRALQTPRIYIVPEPDGGTEQ